MFADVLCKTLDGMVEVVEELPRIETILYADWEGSGGFLRVRNINVKCRPVYVYEDF